MKIYLNNNIKYLFTALYKVHEIDKIRTFETYLSKSSHVRRIRQRIKKLN